MQGFEPCPSFSHRRSAPSACPAGANCGSFCSYNDDFGMTHADCVRWCRDEDISISLAEVCRDYDQVPKDEQGDCVKYYASIANPGQNRP